MFLTDVVRVRSPSAKMIPLRVTVLLIPLVVNFQEISGECPRMEDIPVMWHGKLFTCMKYWTYKAIDDYSVNACRGEYLSTVPVLYSVTNACTQL